MSTRFTKAVFIIIMATVVLILSDMARTMSNAYSMNGEVAAVSSPVTTPTQGSEKVQGQGSDLKS